MKPPERENPLSKASEKQVLRENNPRRWRAGRLFCCTAYMTSARYYFADNY
jgi:hypothetical protein